MIDKTNTLNLLGVDYVHVKTADGGDLYLTKFGVPFFENLKPESWYEPEWFEQNREKLEGTSTVYRVRTKPVNGRSKDLVVKWCRVGEEVPFDTFTLTKFVEAEFNSPYEEFSLVMEMRDDPSHTLVRTHKPLAIYVPAKKLKLWQTGRSQIEDRAEEGQVPRRGARHLPPVHPDLRVGQGRVRRRGVPHDDPGHRTAARGAHRA